MLLTISIIDSSGAIKATASAEEDVTLVYTAPYAEGDTILMLSDAPCFVVAQAEDSIAQTFGYLTGQYCLSVPFGEKRVSYSPKSFMGDIHLLRLREATMQEISARKNLCLNPLDSHENEGLFPHAHANVETRGEAVFAARNAVDGCHANAGHGPWPYQSWGINRNPDAEITVDFGRMVQVDTLVFTLRADFPHDNWWKTATVTFSDGSIYHPQFSKSEKSQRFPIPPRVVRWMKVGALLKDERDPSPFPALTQLEAWGMEASL